MFCAAYPVWEYIRNDISNYVTNSSLRKPMCSISIFQPKGDLFRTTPHSPFTTTPHYAQAHSSTPGYLPVTTYPQSAPSLQQIQAECCNFKKSNQHHPYMKNIYKKSKLRENTLYIYNYMNDPFCHIVICFSTKNISYK